jgi:arylsulfatase A-like enzyme
MIAKKSFLLILRIFFVLLSILFIKDAFYIWDGISYYMKFSEFLPVVSLAFIVLSIIGIISAFSLWLALYLILNILKIFSKSIKFEHIWAWLVLCIIIMIIKRTFLNIPLYELLGLNLFTVYIIGIAIVAVAVYLLRNYIVYIVKATKGLNARITPLVWFFAIFLVLAIPFSIIKREPFDINSESKNLLQRTSLGQGEKRPDVIVVVWDALTAQDMGMYGYDRPTTPFLSEWAKDAIVFNRAYSSSNWTSPSAMSLMTGQRPWTHRYWHYHVYSSKGKRYDKNLPRILKNNGYAVYGFVQNSYAHPDVLGIGGDFLEKDDSKIFNIPRRWWLDKLLMHIKSQLALEWILSNRFMTEIIKKFRPDDFTTRFPSEKVYNRFLDFLSELNSGNDSRPPFFAYLHVFPPHDLYLPPKPYMGKFGDIEKLNSEKKQLAQGLLREYKQEEQEMMDILRKRYDEFILYSDEQLRSFISRLAKTIDMSNTIIIFTSDHGESFSHNYHGHNGPHLYEPFVHVPLIIKTPGKTRGKTIDTPAEIVDIAPTILELVDIPAPKWMEGQSLFPVIEDGTLERQPIFSMQLIKNRATGNSPITKGTLAVWDGDYKLIHYLEDKTSLLFNIKTDPAETRNILNEQPEVAQRLIKLIDDNISSANDRTKKYLQ